jgi:nucleoside-triphosphatase
MPTQNVFILSGAQGAGKTTSLLQLLSELEKRQVALYGFVALGYWERGQRSRFDLVDIRTKKKKLLCINQSRDGFWKQGRFYFNQEAVEWGLGLLPKKNIGLAVLDEVGRFELDGGVWAPLVERLLKNGNHVLMVVRDVFVQDVMAKFGIVNPLLIKLNEDYGTVADKISQKLAKF